MLPRRKLEDLPERPHRPLDVGLRERIELAQIEQQPRRSGPRHVSEVAWAGAHKVKRGFVQHTRKEGGRVRNPRRGRGIFAPLPLLLRAHLLRGGGPGLEALQLRKKLPAPQNQPMPLTWGVVFE